MNLQDCTNTNKKSYGEFCESGLKNIRAHKSDDYFIYGNFDSDRTRHLDRNMSGYEALNYVCFASDHAPHFLAYKFLSPMVIEQNHMIITEDMVKLFEDFKQEAKDKKELYITVDLNSLDREFLLILAVMFFKSDLKAKVRFLYLSSKDYYVPLWLELQHEKPEVLFLSPGSPAFESSVLILIAGFEANAVKKLVDRFKPHKLIIGYNKEGVNKEIHEMNIQTHERLNKQYLNGGTDRMIDFKCDVKDPVGCCLDIYKKLKEQEIQETHHVKLAATNTRLSLIGAALFAAQKNNCYDVQLVYAKPKNFDENRLSQGVTDYYEYIFDPSHLDIVKEDLHNETNKDVHFKP